MKKQSNILNNQNGAGKKVVHTPRVVVKFQDTVQLSYEDGIEKQLEEWELSEWYKLKEKYPNITFKRLFDELEPAKILELVARATELDHTYKPPNFLTYFVIDCKRGIFPDEVVKLLSDWQIIETVYLQSPPLRPAMPDDDPRFAMQGYLRRAPEGIDAVFAWRSREGDPIQFIDIEGGWKLDHEDLPTTPSIGLLSGLNADRPDHGTAVLGQVVSVDNTIGCIGVAPDVTANVIGDNRVTGFSHAAAILDAVTRVSFGDVLLSEIQAAGGLPIEVQQAEFDAIRLATALGIICIEPAGNGANDLDTFRHPTRGVFLNRGLATFRDSGAIMVGSSRSTSPHTRFPTSSFGSRIDCYAWGENITTLTTDNRRALSLYTNSFGMTSGASPIVAGAAILVQSIAQTEFRYRLSPTQLRRMLSDRDPAINTPSAAPAADRIGVMPNLGAIIGRMMHVAPDFYVRDYAGDTGDAHTFGSISTSPDIIVRNARVTDPQREYGRGSGREDRNDLSVDPLTTDTDHFIYIRVSNRGGEDGINVQATVYWAEPATLVTPGSWREIGRTTIPSVRRGEQLIVSPAIPWNRRDIPPTGHYCFVCLIGNDRDPAPERVDLVNWDNYERFIRNNNNVAWRNFNTETRPSRPNQDGFAHFDLSFLLTGAEDRQAVFDVEILPMLPEGAEVLFRAPDYLIDVLTLGTPYKKVDPNDQTATLPIASFGKHRFSDVLLPAQLRARCALEVRIPEKQLKQNDYSIAIRQFHKNLRVGGITWHLTIKDPE